MEIDEIQIEPCKFCGNTAPVLYRKKNFMLSNAGVIFATNV